MSTPSTTSSRRVALYAALLLPLVFVPALTYYRHYKRTHFWAPLNLGAYAGSVDRPVSHYDPRKRPSRPWADAKRAATPQTTYHRYKASAINGQETDYLLYLPPGYDEPASAGRRYPVIYWLHGYAAAPQYALPFLEMLDAAVKKGECPPVIAVLPNGLKDSWYVDSVDNSQPVESVIVRDLIPHVDATCRTIADREHRAVEGFSMGAWGAAHLAFKYPDLFCAATLIAAPMHTHSSFPQFSTIFKGDERAFYAEDPVTIAKHHAAKLRTRIQVRIFTGDKDPTYPFAQAFDRELTEWNVPHEYRVAPGVGHDDDGVYSFMGTKGFAFYAVLFGG